MLPLGGPAGPLCMWPPSPHGLQCPQSLWSHARSHPSVPMCPWTESHQLAGESVYLPPPSPAQLPTVSTHIVSENMPRAVLGDHAPDSQVSVHVSHGHRWGWILLTEVPKVSGVLHSLCLVGGPSGHFGGESGRLPAVPFSGLSQAPLHPQFPQRKPKISS